MPITDTTTLLQMALVGYDVERQKIQQKITEIQTQLNGRGHRAGTQVSDAPLKAT